MKEEAAGSDTSHAQRVLRIMRNIRWVLASLCLISAPLEAQPTCAAADAVPHVSIGASKDAVEAGQPVTFTVKSGAFLFPIIPFPVSYEVRACDRATWDFGDGSPVVEVGALEQVSHTFAPGFWTVSLFTKNNVGMSMTVKRTINVATSPATVVSIADLTVSEAVGTAHMTVRRSGNLTTTATLTYNHFPTFGPQGENLEPVSGTLTFAPGETEKSVAIRITNDNVYKIGMLGTFAIRNNGGFFMAGTYVNGSQRMGAQASIRVTDDEPAPTLSIEDVALEEGTLQSRTMKFPLRISSAVVGAAQVTVELLREGSARTDDIHFAGPYSGIVQSGMTVGDVWVAINGDAEIEENETLRVRITYSDLPVANGTATGTIINDDIGFLRKDLRLPRGAHETLRLLSGPPRGVDRTVALRTPRTGVVEVPDSVVIPANATGVDIPVTATRAGQAVIVTDLDIPLPPAINTIANPVPPAPVKQPPPEATVTVFEPSMLASSAAAVTVRSGSHGEVSLTMNPPRSYSQLVLLSSTDPNLASVPASAVIPPGGSALVEVKGLAAGRATVRAETAEGDAATQFDVSISDGPARSRPNRR